MYVGLWLDGLRIERRDRVEKNGEFKVDAPRGASVTASKGDLHGRATIENGEVVVVVMKQMPL